jgi:hypothetical protein
MPQSQPTKTQNYPNTSTLCNLSPRKNKKLATSQSTTYFLVTPQINNNLVASQRIEKINKKLCNFKGMFI